MISLGKGAVIMVDSTTLKNVERQAICESYQQLIQAELSKVDDPEQLRVTLAFLRSYLKER